MRTTTGPRWWVYLGLLAWTLTLCGSVAVLASEIELVEVHSQVLGDKVHPLLIDRVNRAVLQVAHKALIGRPVSEVDRYNQDYVTSLTQVYNSSISGFSLERLEIVPGKISLVQAVLRPVGERVNAVQVNWITDQAMPDWVNTTVLGRLAQYESQVKQVYQGVPLESLSWAGPSLLAEAGRLLPEVPGFTVNLSVAPAERTELTIQVLPEVPRIYEVRISTHSQTLPPAVQRQLSGQIHAVLGELKGLPVSFACEQQSELEDRLSLRLAENTPLQAAKLKYRVRLSVAALTTAEVSLDSDIYKLLWEGAVNFGNEARPQLRLEAGRYLTPATRVLADVEIPVTSLEFKLGLGVGIHVFGGDLVFVYSLADQKPVLRYEYQLDQAQRVRVKKDWESGEWELAYGIKHTSYLTTEVVGNHSGIWFRLVGSL